MMEIERKYLVETDVWEKYRNPANAYHIQQAYLNTDPACTIRVRVSDNKAALTIKGKSSGISREEFEYPVPLQDGLDMMRLAVTPVIGKLRYIVHYHGFTWEVDEFLGDNEGLVLAEVELKSEDQHPDLPEWTGKEVSGDPGYYNLQLALHPIKDRR
jgi:adenylate cyclase